MVIRQETVICSKQNFYELRNMYANFTDYVLRTFSPFLSSHRRPKYSFSEIFNCVVTQCIKSRPLALFFGKKTRVNTYKLLLDVDNRDTLFVHDHTKSWHRTSLSVQFDSLDLVTLQMHNFTRMIVKI